jgi:hypothetical protein
VSDSNHQNQLTGIVIVIVASLSLVVLSARKWPDLPGSDDDGSIGPNALFREDRDAQTCMQSVQISRGRLTVPRQWQCRQNTGSCDMSECYWLLGASPWWLGLPTLGGCSSLPRSVGAETLPTTTTEAGRVL